MATNRIDATTFLFTPARGRLEPWELSARGLRR
jgi:hypothetical protein